MRTFEILIILFNFTGLLIWLLPGLQPRWLPLITGAAVFSSLVHGVIEGTRWQMIPLYVLTAVLFFLSLRRIWLANAARSRKIDPGRPKWIYPALGLIGLLFASLPPVLLPVPQPLQPTGPYPVGTTSFEWIDESRTEMYAEEPGGPRRMMVQVWYPAAPDPQAEHAPYLERIELSAGAIAENFDLPPFLLDHLRLARTNAYSNAPPAESATRFPVLLFSHGWTGMRVQNTYQMEELASHGYIVFSPDHTYGSVVTVFPNGDIIFANPNALPPRGTPPEEYDPVARRLGQTWVEDLRFTLAQADRMDAGEIDPFLAGRLDLDQVGVLGHSTGGGAAIEFCWIEPRCQAGVSMDAWLIPYDRDMLSEGIGKPILLMQSEAWKANRNPPLVDELYANLPEGSFRMTLAGTAHYDFTDIPQLTELGRFIGLSGSGASEKTLRIINDFSVSFFDLHIKGSGDINLTNLAQRYREVKIVD